MLCLQDEEKFDFEAPKPIFGHGEKASHVVFFGRLEYRKGLSVFLDALDLLFEEQLLPKQISFLGKEGGDLPFGPNYKPLEFINARTEGWPTKIEVITNLDQPEAMKFLLQRGILAVMPSLIENSSLAVYETLLLNVPFIASEVGGTPELIHEQDLKNVLFDNTPFGLAKKIKQALLEGNYRARLRFNNQQNIQIWRSFHNTLSLENFSESSFGFCNHPQFNIKAESDDISEICICVY